MNGSLLCTYLISVTLFSVLFFSVLDITATQNDRDVPTMAMKGYGGIEVSSIRS